MRGMTLIELMVALTIGGILLAAGLPMMSDYIVNSRLREGGNALYMEAMFAQSEAIKRNGSVTLTVEGNSLQVVNAVDDTEDDVLRDRILPRGVTAGEATSISFGSDGRPTPLAETTIALSSDSVECSGDYRCPSVTVQAGGAIKQCKDKNNCD
jgi:type IV fimbrial biogenesis protein FimT